MPFSTDYVKIVGSNDEATVEVKSDGVDNAAVVTQNSQPLPTGAATSDNQTNGSQVSGVKIYDTVSTTYKGLKFNAEAPQVCSQSYLQALAEGDITGHTGWAKIGFNGGLVASTEADVWSGTGTINWPASAMQMEVISSSANDTGTTIHSGTSTTGGSTTTLQKTGENFLTTTAAGDLIIVDAAGTTPEWGYITSVDSDTQITFSNGLSSGGSGASRITYAIIDKSASTGAHAVKIEYLNGSYITDSEIVVLNGTTAVATTQTDLYRINSFRIIATGSGNAAAGNLSLRNVADTPIYSYITAGYSRARNCAYTVPSGKTLYLVQFAVSYGYSTNQTHYCRIYTRANVEPLTMFNTGSLFYPYTEIICANSSQLVTLEIPTKLPAKTDIKVSALATYAGAVSCALRGWLE